MEIYLLKSTLCLTVLYFVYRLIAGSESNYQVRRIIGLLCIVLSTTFLLLPYEFLPEKTVAISLPAIEKGTTLIQQSITDVLPKESYSIYLLIYFIGAGLFSIRTLTGLSQLARIYFKSPKFSRWGFTVVSSDQAISPFTFFNLLFISKKDLDSTDVDPIILHEQLHRRQLHSVDTLILEILTIIHWFNPIAWLFRKNIRADHEYQADHHVLKSGIESADYQDMLFKARTGVSFRSVNYLSIKTSLKNRFKMMEKQKINSKYSYFRIATFTLLGVLVAVAISFLPLNANGQLGSNHPDFKVFYDAGEVDLEKGIPTTTERLFVTATGNDQSEVKFRVSETNITLVVDGYGIGTAKAGDRIALTKILQKNSDLKGGMLLIEVLKYQVKDEQDIISEFPLEKPFFIKIPLI